LLNTTLFNLLFSYKYTSRINSITFSTSLSKLFPFAIADISAMAKGNSLDKLVEKVMELIREVYL